MKPVTTALKETCQELGIDLSRHYCYSDSRTPRNLPAGHRAVGVKVMGHIFDQGVTNRIRAGMESKGYTFHYARFNGTVTPWGNYTWSAGTRFCFSKPN